MKIVETIAALQALIAEAKQTSKVVGFVPTMGALHQGHISLVEESKKTCNYTVVSIFVNPTQFNNASDLEHYPRTLEDDCKALEAVGVDCVFAPSVEEIYPEEDTRQFNFGPLETVMEGEHRPGHFNGVAQVVSKLFAMVDPDKSFFGEKDFQQLAIIKAMVKQLNLSVEIIPCPIIRESDGLAMSSRNLRLSPQHRAIAPLISKTLSASKRKQSTLSIEGTKRFVIDAIKAEPLLELEYFDIADTLSLQSAKDWNEPGEKVGCIAVFAGDIRLIDNIVY